MARPADLAMFRRLGAKIRPMVRRNRRTVVISWSFFALCFSGSAVMTYRQTIIERDETWQSAFSAFD
jgi:hypothetical protein